MGDAAPFTPEDPIDFLLGTEIQEAFALYEEQYKKLDAQLNVQMPEALLEYNRWVLVIDLAGQLVAFACFKTMDDGLKLGILATNGALDAKTAAKTIVRAALVLDGVYAEVSGGLERTLAGQVTMVASADAEIVLGKPIERLPDGVHYRRQIANVGLRTKVMVGRPHLPS